MMRRTDISERVRSRRDPLLDDVLRDLLVTTIGFLLAVAAVVLTVDIFAAH